MAPATAAAEGLFPEIRHFPRLARLMLICPAQGFLRSGRFEMSKSIAKFEAFAFAFGFVMTGFVTLVALPLA